MYDVCNRYEEKLGRLEDDVQDLKQNVQDLKKRMTSMEANSSAYMKSVRRFLVALAREKLVQRAGFHADQAAARWNDCLDRLLADPQLRAACGLSRHALCLTERGQGTETDVGNIAAHEISQATVRVAIDIVHTDEKGPWEELFNVVYNQIA